MLLRILGAVGIGRCPYEKECGPETPWISDRLEEIEAERTCYTFHHRSCEKYKKITQEQKRRKLENMD